VKLSIVVVTWRSVRDLRRLIASMKRQLEPRIELVVVDNASGDRIEAEVRDWPGDVRFIQLEENIGYGAAANRGVELAAGNAIVLLNPDTELIDASLVDLARFALDRRALAGPRVLRPDGSTQPSASGPPAGAWPWVGAIVPGKVQPRSIQAHTEPWRLRRAVKVAWLAGACLTGPRDVLCRLGPFDPAIHLYCEDMDLGLRAGLAGVPSYFRPDLGQVVHHGRGSTSQLLPNGPWDLIARNRRAVIRRVYGRRRERAAQRALLLNLALRTASKRVLRRDAGLDGSALRAAINARGVPALPAASPASSTRGAGRRPTSDRG
jgi:N-acetylglucosaminyl-diphospho-decaprenol L-rhamnosyltransferase